MDSIAKTTAIVYGIGNSQIKCDRCHHTQEKKDEPRCGLPIRAEKQMDAQQELDEAQSYRKQHGKRGEKFEMKSHKIILELIHSSVKVYCFYKSRKDERPPYNQAGQKNKPFRQRGFSFLFNCLVLHILSV